MVSPPYPSGGGFIKREVGFGQLQIEKILAAGQMQGAGLGEQAFAALQKIGDVLATERLEDKGVLHGAGHRLGAIDLAQGHDLL